MISIQTALERLIEAQTNHRPLAPFSETHGDFSLEHAYAVQDAFRAELDQRAQRAIGWKLGATSPSGQAVMGVTEPACGFLMPHRYANDAKVVGTHTSAEVMGNPLSALVWLANHLATRGLALEPGDIVMSGAITRMLRPQVGDTIRARFAHLGSVGLTVVA